jgi:predicted O-methyltransferase YrrM
MHSLEVEMRQWAEIHQVPILASASADYLAALVREKKPRKILEIGCAIGYSALLIAQHCAVDGKITTLEIDPERITIAKDFIARTKQTERIEIIQGDANALISTLAGPYDFVFLDGPKGQYLRQLQQLLPDKLTQNATIVADNVAFRGMVGGAVPCLPRYKTLVARLRQYIEFVSTDPRFLTKIITEADHLAISDYTKEL